MHSKQNISQKVITHKAKPVVSLQAPLFLSAHTIILHMQVCKANLGNLNKYTTIW